MGIEKLNTNTEFIRAVSYGNINLARKLLICDAEIDTVNDKGQTPLMIATIKGNIDLVDLLLQHGASIYKQDLFGNSAVKYARLNCQSAILSRFNSASTLAVA